ncbi:Transposon Tf2-12 polyprotein [Sesamum angolense]|uniref:Transposon Tf2-12 polyprotein n=1 Tax=Sesamum angolense TaxID=2727404 RepID=A0AAE2C2E9_9LAMI|nr:Transposon Tf2-12 polyprotein [Sesamum angolense]
MKQPSKPPLKGFVPSTQEEEGGHEALAIDEKGFDPKAFKLLIKAGYDPKEKLSLGKLPPEATDKKLHGLNATQIMLKEKGHAIQDSRVGLGFTLPKPVRITIKRVNSNYIFEGFSSTKDHKREENLRESVFNRHGPHRKELRRIANRQSVFDRVLKVKAQTMITQVQSDDEDSKEIVASSNYISNSVEENIAQTYHITLIEDGEVEEEDAEDAPVELEEGTKATIDELKEVNLGDIKNPRPIYISASLTGEERTYIALLNEFKDRRFRPELIPLIEGEVNKLIEVGFIREDLNNACPKDDFPLPLAELMIDATIGHEALSFMDGSSGYNQICMAPTDEELTAFRTPKGIYCYKVMPFGLKNADATYQRAMQKIFDDIFHKNVECYVDDLVVKSKKRENYFHDLRKVFELLRRYQLKMNPSKCAFGVTSGKFLGFIIRQRGIEIEQAKINAILRMPEPRNIHELKSLQGKLAYLRRFISNLAGRCQPFSRLMKKDVPFQWDEACDKAFKSIKSYLMKPLVLVAPVPGRSLILYIAAHERSVGILLAQKNDEGKENALYYLSRTMTPNELKYSPIEKLCLSLIFSIQKLKHYFQSHIIHLVSKANPLKYIMVKPVLSDMFEVKLRKKLILGLWCSPIGAKTTFPHKENELYLPTMVKYCINYARRCQACQFHANLIHQPHEPLHPTVASWPFDAWGLDVVGPLMKSSGGHLYILATTDYFSKWAEAVPLKEVKKEMLLILSAPISFIVTEYLDTSSPITGNPFAIA